MSSDDDEHDPLLKIHMNFLLVCLLGSVLYM